MQVFRTGGKLRGIELLQTRLSRRPILVIALAVAGCGGGPQSTPVKTTPTITWATPAAIAFGTALSSTQLDATASVAGAFTYTPAAGTVLASGSQVLSAAFMPSDTADYNSASATVSLTVTPPAGKVAPTITWATPAAMTYGTALSATQLNAAANAPGVFNYNPALGTVLPAGTETLGVTFTPTDATDYATATASVQLLVNQATPAITWPTPAAVIQGTMLSATQLDATASVPGTFDYTPPAGYVLDNTGATPLKLTFSPADSADYATATASVSLIVNPVAGSAVVDYGAAEQTIRGFGGSEAWYGPMSNSEITALYGTSGSDLGLSIMRLRIAPTTWTSSTQAADTSAWTAEIGNGKAAQALGATVFASPWTPPATMKTNNSTNEGSLNTSSYADYANYLEAYVRYATNQGLNLYAVSMQNEPDWNPCDPNGTDEGPNGKDCYESCLWTAAQMDAWVAGSGSVLTRGTTPVKLMMPESLGFSSNMSDTALDDTVAAANISIVGGHLYGASPYYYTNAVNKGKELWVTEHYLNAVSGGLTTSIADALAAAEEIHNSMTVGQYNAYVWWWVNNGSGATTAAGLIDTNNNPTYFGYALAQFSRFVRPGYVRVNATASPVSGVYLSAYAGNGHMAIVAINSNSTATLLPVTIQNPSPALTSMTPWQTTSAGGLAQQNAVNVTGNNFTYTLPAESITTFVQ
jgi:glucuronoarabinoxylan endo-1,4-beta-xylanase